MKKLSFKTVSLMLVVACFFCFTANAMDIQTSTEQVLESSVITRGIICNCGANMYPSSIEYLVDIVMPNNPEIIPCKYDHYTADDLKYTYAVYNSWQCSNGCGFELPRENTGYKRMKGYCPDATAGQSSWYIILN